jgi:hypothetical protein
MCMLIKILESRDVTFFENIFPMKKIVWHVKFTSKCDS